MHFTMFDVCLDGKWEERSCDKGSLFWAVTNCCIPLDRYPTFDECILSEGEKDRSKTTRTTMSGKSSVTTPIATTPKAVEKPKNNNENPTR